MPPVAAVEDHREIREVALVLFQRDAEYPGLDVSHLCSPTHSTKTSNGRGTLHLCFLTIRQKTSNGRVPLFLLTRIDTLDWGCQKNHDHPSRHHRCDARRAEAACRRLAAL